MGLEMIFGEPLNEKKLAEQKAAIVPKALEISKVKNSAGNIKAVSFKPYISHEKVKGWILNIKKTNESIIKTFPGIKEVPKDLKWDGTDFVGKIAKTDVNYIFDCKVKDKVELIIKSMRQIIQSKNIMLVESNEEIFRPKRGHEIFVVPIKFLFSSKSDERKQIPFIIINKRIKEIVSWEFDILTLKGVFNKKFSGSGNMSLYLIWNGKNFDGNYVNNLKDCRYILTITGKDGNKAQIKDIKIIRVPFIILTKKKILKAFKCIYFDVNSYQLKQKMKQRLKEIVENFNIYIQGHSSIEGDKDYHIFLSQQRAKTILRFMVKKYKVFPLLITIDGYRSDIPYNTKNTEYTKIRFCWSKIIIMGEVEK